MIAVDARVASVDARVATNESPDAAPIPHIDAAPAPVNTVLTLHPKHIVGNASVLFEFDATRASTFECQLDSDQPFACSSPLTLNVSAEGPHVLLITATALDGSVDPTPARASWILDPAPPTVTLSVEPTDPSEDPTPSFGFTADESSTFVCQLDGVASFATCTSEWAVPTSLAPGDYTFRVIATDAVGGTSDEVDYQWSVVAVGCGNGILDTGEQCDDGAANGSIGDDCSASCALPPPPPTADSQSIATDQNVAVAVTLTGSDVNSASLTYAVLSSPKNGSLSGIAPDLTYTPNTNFYGVDSFTFDVNNGTADSTSATVSITVNEDFTSMLTGVIGVGVHHACALVNGGVQCWGDNDSGELGNNSATESNVPVQVIGITSGAVAVVVGGDHACALVHGGVQCWGDNSYGQLGNGSTVSSKVPVPVTGLSTGVQAISAGLYTTCALAGGGVQCWGFGGTGALGNDATAGNSNVPVQVVGLTSGVTAIAAGAYHGCAIVNGGVQCWGENDFGELGNGTAVDSSVPVSVVGIPSGATAITAGTYHVCAIVNGGEMCWGYGFDGELGNGTSRTSSDVPVSSTGLSSDVELIAAGEFHNCAVVDGGVQCWGYGGAGQTGDGGASGGTLPVQVEGLPSGSGVQALAAGAYETCALVAGGVQCWGDNTDGDIGDNSITQANVPTAVSAFQ